MNWQEDVIKLIDEYFKSIAVKYTPKNEVDNCLIDFFNFEMKLIKPVPRVVYKSDVLKGRILPLQFSKALHEIELKIKRGDDLTLHLSKKVLDPTYTDDLLNDWVIHHLHLSTTKSKSGQRFFDRSKYLLFFAYSKQDAFLIDVREHKEDYVFAKKEFLEIMDNSWPTVMEQYYWKDVSEVSPNCSDEEISELRKKGYTIGAYNVNGKAIRSPGLGITTTGQNIQVVRRADWVVRYLHEACQELENESEI